MASCLPDSLRDGEEYWLVNKELGFYLEFFPHFALNRGTRVFIWFDVAATR